MPELDKDLENNLLSAKDTTETKVRFNDTDAMGVVHFKNYLIYLDDGFVNFMENLIRFSSLKEIVQKGILFPVKRIDIIYEGSAKFGDYIVVKTYIKKLGNTSITFYHEMFKKSDMTLLAKVECVRVILYKPTNELFNVKEFFANYI